MSTHATPPDPPDPARRRRNRGLLLVLLLAFFGALLLAGALRFSGWRPEGSKNRGELLDPYPDMRALVPQLADGRPYRWKDSPRTWRIVVMPGDCGGAARAGCVRLLGDLDKVWQLMGKDADRVHLLWVGPPPAGVALPPEVRVLRPDPGLRAGLPPPPGAPAGGSPVWLVDPHGFTVLRYRPGFAPGDLRADLARLLKIN